MVRIRDHPLMSYRGTPNWPPVWTQMKIKDVKSFRGEVGVLVYVHGGDYSQKCYLVIEHENENYVGTLLFDNATFCHLIAKLLRQHIGKTIKDIGDVRPQCCSFPLTVNKTQLG